MSRCKDCQFTHFENHERLCNIDDGKCPVTEHDCPNFLSKWYEKNVYKKKFE